MLLQVHVSTCTIVIIKLKQNYTSILIFKKALNLQVHYSCTIQQYIQKYGYDHLGINSLYIYLICSTCIQKHQHQHHVELCCWWYLLSCCRYCCNSTPSHVLIFSGLKNSLMMCCFTASSSVVNPLYRVFKLLSNMASVVMLVKVVGTYNMYSMNIVCQHRVP